MLIITLIMLAYASMKHSKSCQHNLPTLSEMVHLIMKKNKTISLDKNKHKDILASGESIVYIIFKFNS